MRIKNAFLVLCCMLTMGCCFAQTDILPQVQQQNLETQIWDSLYQAQQQQIESLVQENKSLKNNISNLTHRITALQTQINNLSTSVDNRFEEQQTSLNVISSSVSVNAENITSTSTTLNERINQSDEKTSIVSTSLKNKTIWGIVAAVILLIISVLLFFLLRKRIIIGNTAIDDVKETQKKLQEESVKLDNKLVELLEGQMKLQDSKKVTESVAPDHSLALKIADEITRIETNLSRMDASIRGYKQLTASVKRIKDNFMANGYELVEMLGKPYNEGMRVNADFVIDENLEEGKRIISTVTKPQVNYNGEMIQKATITVSQNI